MSKREAVARYNLIINKLRKHPASFDEILSYLEVESDIQSYNFVVSLRTFQRDLADILSIYNIEINYDFSRASCLWIREPQPPVPEVLEGTL